MNLHRILPLLALALNLLLLGTALAPDRRSSKNRVFAWFTCALAVWNFGVFGLRSATTPESGLLWERFLHVGVIALPVLFYHYVIVFLDAPRRDRGLRMGYIACGLFLLVSPTSIFMSGVVTSEWGFMPVVGPIYGVFFLYFNSYLVLGLVRLLRAGRFTASGVMRNRAVLVVGGVSISLVGGLLDFVRFIFNIEWIYPLGIPSNAAFALALGVAILRYRLMDVRLLAKRVMVYALTALAFAPILFLGLLFLHRTVVLDALVLSAAFVLALPILNRLGAALDQLMFRRQHGVRDALRALSRELPLLLDRQRLAETLTTELVTRIPASHATLHVHDEGGRGLHPISHTSSEVTPDGSPADITPALAAWVAMAGQTLIVEETMFHGDALTALQGPVIELQRQRVALVVPLVLEGQLVAVMSVGEKLSGEMYETDEIELLEMLVQEAAVAFKNAGLYDDLREQMAELTRAQSQLMQSAKLAAIGELAASVAHEVNNPLMVILGSAGILRRRSDMAAADEKLSVIEAQAMRAGNIIRGLLDFARRRERRPENVSISNVIDRALGLVRDKLKAQDVEVVTLFEDAGAYVYGDRDELTQVFINLINNAADAMADGGRLSLSSEVCRHEDLTYLSIRVTDTGTGIDAETLAQIFDPFFTTKAEGKGTGLGLSLTLGIVKKHEGTIHAESAVGKGTSMVINLPISNMVA